jgi:chemotaxis methyl-accepting protein methylase
MSKKNISKQHTKSLEKMLTAYKTAYFRHKQSFNQIRKIVSTSEGAQNKVFDVLNIVHVAEIEDATETGILLA